MTGQETILLALALPLLGALGIALAGRFPDLREGVTLATAIGLVITVWSLIPGVMAGGAPAITLLDITPTLSVAFSVEPLGMLFAAFASLLWVVNSVYAIGYMRGNKEKHQTRFYACFAVALSAAMGIAFAGNLFTLFLFYEVLTLSTYPLVAHKGDAATVRSARIYIGILIGTSIGLLLPAIIWTGGIAGTLDFTPGGILAGKIAGPALAVLLALYLFGIGKAAVMPVHRWLPAAMVAPTPVSALLHAVAVVKAGVFTVAKVAVYIFGIDFLKEQGMGTWLMIAAATTILLASLVALRQTNLKRLLAYSTISQLSYVVLAVSVLAPLSLLGAAFHLVAHAFAKITLFFAAGSIYTASKKTELGQLDGIGRLMPWTMGAFTIGALSMIGIPPTVGFVSKWFIMGGAMETGQYLVVATLALSTLLNAGYFLPIVYRAFAKAPPVGAKPHGEAPLPIVVALSFTALMVIVLFFLNQPVLDLIGPVTGGF